jgi:hypothetical protein
LRRNIANKKQRNKAICNICPVNFLGLPDVRDELHQLGLYGRVVVLRSGDALRDRSDRRGEVRANRDWHE